MKIFTCHKAIISTDRSDTINADAKLTIFDGKTKKSKEDTQKISQYGITEMLQEMFDLACSCRSRPLAPI
jgi:hypothetical protein